MSYRGNFYDQYMKKNTHNPEYPIQDEDSESTLHPLHDQLERITISMSSKDLRTKNHSLNKRMKTVEKENDQFRIHNQSLNQKVSRLETQNKKLEEENESLKNFVDALSKFKTDNQLLNQNSQIQKNNKKLLNQNSQLQKNNKKLNKENTELEKRLAVFECKDIEIYVRNKILSYNSKNKQEIKPSHQIDNEQKALIQLFSEHENNMTNWIIFSQKMNQTYRNCKDKISKNNNNMSLWNSFSDCKALWQQQQNQMELIVEKLAQLQAKKRNLKTSVSDHKNTTTQQNNKYKEELNKYTKTNKIRIESENNLKIRLQELNNYCDKENKLNENKCILLDELNKFEIELKQYESLLNQCNKLMKKYRKFDSDNDTAIKEMTHYFKNKWTENMRIWYKWTAESIVYWLKYLRENGTLLLSGNINFDKILKQMETNGVSGKSFETIDKNDLKAIGFKILSDRQNVFVAIQELISKYPRNSSHEEEGKMDINSNEVVIPNEFKCPISKKIMNEPVLIFDGHTYEKVNIEKYLNKYKESPITKEKCDDDDIWFQLNRPLKQKIIAFLKVNPQFQ